MIYNIYSYKDKLSLNGFGDRFYLYFWYFLLKKITDLFEGYMFFVIKDDNWVF